MVEFEELKRQAQDEAMKLLPPDTPKSERRRTELICLFQLVLKVMKDKTLTQISMGKSFDE